MKLLTNDDGIFAPGIRSLANGLAETGHDVSVVCPDRAFRNWTWFDLHQPIRAEIVESVFNPPLKPGPVQALPGPLS